MERKLDRNRRLADYIYDDLGPEEIVEIEREIMNDPHFSQSYRLNMQVKDYLQAKVQLEDMRSDLQLEDAEKLADMAFNFDSHIVRHNESKPAGHNRKSIRYLSYAAAIAVAVTIIIAAGIIPSGIDQEKLFDRYYEPIEASDYMQRGELSETYNNIAEGIFSYSEGNFSQTITLFNGLASDPLLQPELHFFTGLSFMGLGQYQDAQNMLEMIVDGNSRYQPEALWYLSLCYMKAGEFSKAVVLLGQLEAYDGMYKKDAQTLRKKLRRFK